MKYLADYQPFIDKHELNEQVNKNKHIERCQYELNETDRDVLMMLSRYSVKYAGVSHLKGKSTITVRRTLNKLAKLRIIEKKSFFTKSSRRNWRKPLRIFTGK